MSKTSIQYNLFSASSAFFLWGGWAYYVNSAKSETTGMISGITQGIASFTITLLVVYAVTKIYNRLPTGGLRLILPAVITVTCIGVCLVFIHTLAGTPYILPTIAPSLSVAFLFCTFTAYKLGKTESLSEETS
jgi:hypothetical protein